MDVDVNLSGTEAVGPETSDEWEGRIRQTVDELVGFVRDETNSLQLLAFEQTLWPQITEKAA